MSERILKKLKGAVQYFDDEAKRLAEEAVAVGMDPVMVLEEGLAKSLREVGDSFGRGEAFVTELIAAAQTMEAGAARAGSRDSLSRAREKENRLLEEHEPEPLSSEASQALNEVLGGILERHGISRSSLPAI
jgi:methanogenic corrinoid protein MtbC1